VAFELCPFNLNQLKHYFLLVARKFAQQLPARPIVGRPIRGVCTADRFATSSLSALVFGIRGYRWSNAFNGLPK